MTVWAGILFKDTGLNRFYDDFLTGNRIIAQTKNLRYYGKKNIWGGRRDVAGREETFCQEVYICCIFAVSCEASGARVRAGVGCDRGDGAAVRVPQD